MEKKETVPKVKCRICGKNFKEINQRHLDTHFISIEEYQRYYSLKRYPSVGICYQHIQFLVYDLWWNDPDRKSMWSFHRHRIEELDLPIIRIFSGSKNCSSFKRLLSGYCSPEFCNRMPKCVFENIDNAYLISVKLNKTVPIKGILKPELEILKRFATGETSNNIRFYENLMKRYRNK